MRNATVADVPEPGLMSDDNLNIIFLISGLSLFGVSTLVTTLALVGGVLIFVRYRALRHAHKYSKGINMSHLHFGQASLNITTNIAVGSVVDVSNDKKEWKWKTNQPLLDAAAKEDLSQKYSAFEGVNAWSTKRKGARNTKAPPPHVVPPPPPPPANTKFRRRISGEEMSNPMLAMQLMNVEHDLQSKVAAEFTSASGDDDNRDGAKESSAGHAPTSFEGFGTSWDTALGSTNRLFRNNSSKSSLAIRRRSDVFESAMGKYEEDADNTKEDKAEDNQLLIGTARKRAAMRRRSDAFESLMNGL
jgi:hypothetical protein